MRKALVVLFVCAVFAAGAAWVLSAPRPVYSADQVQAIETGGDAAAGKLVFYAGGCESCHATPGQPDPLRLGGGLELKTAFGSFYPPNISPDPVDGIGAWKVADLANALQAGVSRGGEHLYPALPYASYQHLTLDDVRNLRAFLNTLPAVQGRAPPHALAFPFSVRRAIGMWKLLYFHPGDLPPAPGRSEAWLRGRALVEGAGHCAECHSPRDFLGGIVASGRLAGGPVPDGHGKAPNITAAGLADWTQQDIADALSTGFTPMGDTLGGAMAPVVRNLAQLPDGDRMAIAEYLKSYPSDAAHPK